MSDDLPTPRARGPSDLEIFDEVWRLVKKGIVLSVLLGGAGFIAGVCWVFIGA